MANLPVITINSRAAARLRGGHVWVYRSDLVGEPQAPAASLIHVQDERKRSLGSALYSSSSQIAVRVLTPELLPSFDAVIPLLQERLRNAIAYRKAYVRDTDSWRVAFSEADGLPGLIIDKYHDIVSIQPLTQAMDRDDVRAAVLEVVLHELQPASVLARVDERIRELEQLPARAQALLHGEKTTTITQMNGVHFHYDALAGQKTGAFLDQRENYAAAAHYAHGRALDVFCYQGGFAMHLARKCLSLTSVDISRPALEVAEQNEQLNKLQHVCGEIEWIEANAFDLLRDYADGGEKYDTIVLDPPAFAKSKKALEGALKGYKEINLRALRMLKPGGVLVTCSCSHHVSEQDFVEMLGGATADARRRLRIIEKRGASVDHPVVPNIAETAYLKCVIARVD